MLQLWSLRPQSHSVKRKSDLYLQKEKPDSNLVKPNELVSHILDKGVKNLVHLESKREETFYSKHP